MSKKKWYKRWWAITLFIIFGLGFLGSLFEDSETSTTQQVTETKTQETVSEKVYKVGEVINVKGVAYRVDSVDTISALGNQLMIKEANGIFYIMGLTIENVENKAKDFFSPNLKIIDSKGREFSEDRGGKGYLSMMGYETFMLEQLQPNLPKTGYVAFDLPKDAKGLKLEISGGLLSTEKVIVDLGV